VCCSELQCVALCCGVMQCVAKKKKYQLREVKFQCVLQCAAVCCSVLQCVAVCSSVL